MLSARGRFTAKLMAPMLAVFVVCWITQAADADVRKKLINFQGYLTDNAVPSSPLDGTYNLTFRIYNQPGDQTPAWTEAHTNVPVIRGNVSVLLGSIAEMKLAFDEPRYLGIQVGPDPEMTPRQQLLPSFHASAAETLVVSHANQQRSEFGVNNLVPVGGIISYFGDPATLPGNWRACDGSVVNDPESPLNGLTLPNMSGRVARGIAAGESAGQSGGQDSDSWSINSHQHQYGFSIGAHSHTINSAGNHKHETTVVGSGNGALWVDDEAPFGLGSSRNTTTFGFSASGSTGNQYFHLTSEAGSHTHAMGAAGAFNWNSETGPAGAASGVINTIPSYVALYYIIRIK